MSYIQGFVIAVPKANKAAYIQSAQQSATLFKEYGATSLMETWSETIADGEVTDFKRAVKAEPDEAIVFSWIVWPDKATHDAAAARMETDPRWQQFDAMPFDGKRMIWGGFEPICEA